MCYVFYAAADSPLPLIPWNETAPGLNVSIPEPAEETVRAHFTKPNVVYIGSDTHCGCGFYEGDNHAGQQKLRLALADYLRNACASGDVEFYCCWSGDEIHPVETRSTVSPEFFATLEFEPSEKHLWTVRAAC
jgi:hypothetical protein